MTPTGSEADPSLGGTERTDDGRPRGDPARWRSWIVAGIVTAGVLVAGVVFLNRGDGDDGAAASPANGGPGQFPAAAGGFGRGANGEVTAVDDSTITIESADPSGSTSTVTVKTSGDTVVTEAVDGQLADLATGDTVVVTGETTDEGIEATSISETAGTVGGAGPPGGGQPPEGFEPPEGAEPPEGFEPPDGAPQFGADGGIAAGEIAAIDGSSLTVETADGETVLVTTSANTTITVTAARSVADIVAGDTIQVIGETEDSVVSAESIVLGELGFGPGGRFGGPGGQTGTADDSATS